MSNLTDPGWIAQFTDHGAPATLPRRPCWRDDLAEFNEVLRSRFALPAGGRRIFGWQVRQAVATHFGLTRAELAGASRLADRVWPRQVAMYLCVRFAGLSCRQTGALFGDRDQTTVRHAVDRVAARIAADPALDQTIGALLAACREITEER
jgi:chromosomal replication initiation ATPase DnaA